MATRRTPKGSYVRATGDFFIERCATVGGAYNPSAVGAAVLDLFNNAVDGSNLHVYRIFVGDDAAGWYGITTLSGHGANFMQNAVPVVTGAARLPGQLYWDVIPPQYTATAGALPVNIPFSDVLFMDNEAGSMDIWTGQGPISVIKPGYSLRVYALCSTTFTAGQMIVASFYYAALPDLG
jgi:hypothetical protein